jgi:hypothetical protein
MNRDPIIQKIERLHHDYPTYGYNLPCRLFLEGFGPGFGLHERREDKQKDITDLLGKLWEVHDEKLSRDFFNSWQNFQNNLFEANPKYRDHYIHSFYVFYPWLLCPEQSIRSKDKHTLSSADETGRFITGFY